MNCLILISHVTWFSMKALLFCVFYVLGCINTRDLGMEDGNIRDSQITASSQWDSGHRPPNGRLNFRAGGGRTGAWSSRYNNRNQWLQVDFRRPTIITGLGTQGRQDHNQFIKTYTISFSDDGKTFNNYRHEGTLKVR